MDRIREKILRATIERYGGSGQQLKAIEELSELIDRIAANDWRIPRGITPATYAPTLHILPSRPAVIEWGNEA
jgi:hypothetical protein